MKNYLNTRTRVFGNILKYAATHPKEYSEKDIKDISETQELLQSRLENFQPRKKSKR